MKPYWVETETSLRLAIVPRPRGGDWLEDELQAMKHAGIDVLASILTAEEIVELGLSQEEALCTQVGLIYRSYSIPDREVPNSHAAFASFLMKLQADLDGGKSLGVHCRASIGRASMLLASVLCAQGVPPTAAFSSIANARGLNVPDTIEQIKWVEGFALYVNQS